MVCCCISRESDMPRGRGGIRTHDRLHDLDLACSRLGACDRTVAGPAAPSHPLHPRRRALGPVRAGAECSTQTSGSDRRAGCLPRMHHDLCHIADRTGDAGIVCGHGRVYRNRLPADDRRLQMLVGAEWVTYNHVDSAP